MKLKKIIVFLLLIVLINYINISSVEAEIVSYGYVECDYECTTYIDGDTSKGKETSVCHDRWSPRQTCKTESGSFVSSAVSHENALKINFGSDGNVQSVETELFDFDQPVTYEHPFGEDIKKLDIKDAEGNYLIEVKANDPNIFVHKGKKKEVTGESIVYVSYYVHNFGPIADYYKKTGKYPEYVAVDYTSHTTGVAGLSEFGNYMYTYYPSDYMTTEHEDKFMMAELNTSGPSSSLVVELSDTDSSKVAKIEYCKRKDVLALSDDDYKSKCMTKLAYGWVNTTHHYYFARNIASVDLNACYDLEADFNYMESLFDQYGEDSKAYIDAKMDFVKKCSYYIGKSFNGENSKCNDCLALEDKMAEKDPSFMKSTNHCGFGEDMIAWLLRMLKIIRYIVPIIVIVLSILDYIGAIASAEDDAMKKVGARFSKRLLIMILIFILPALLQFVFNVFKIDGLDSSNPYCLKK